MYFVQYLSKWTDTFHHWLVVILNTDVTVDLRLTLFNFQSYRRRQRTLSPWKTWISVSKRLWTTQRITTLLLIKKGELLNRHCCSEMAEQPVLVCLWIMTSTHVLVHPGGEFPSNTNTEKHSAWGGCRTCKLNSSCPVFSKASAWSNLRPCSLYWSCSCFIFVLCLWSKWMFIGVSTKLVWIFLNSIRKWNCR